MNKIRTKHIIRFVLFIALQVLVLKRIQIPGFVYMHLIFYPLAILLLPFNTPKIAALFIGFFAGLTVDLFYDSPGINAFCATMIAYLRPYIHKWMEPRGGYAVNSSPTLNSLGNQWMLTYTAIGMFIFILTYFSIHAFTFYFIVSILLKSIISFIVSIILVWVYIFVLNPSE
jgi:rod shape-determining protein MreD